MKVWCERQALHSISDWNSLVLHGLGGTVFHQAWYLSLLGVSHVLCVYSRDGLIAGIPLHEKSNSLAQSTRCVPYSGPVFIERYADRGHMPKRREVTDAMINWLKEQYKSIQFAISTELIDIVPYLRHNFLPEVRFTYIFDTSVPNVLACLNKNRQRDFVKSKNNKIVIAQDDAMEFFDVNKALFWSDKDVFDKVCSIVREAIYLNRGKVFVAKNNEGNVLGGLFLMWDKKRSYTVYSYYDDASTKLGIPTALYVQSIIYTKTVLGLNALDFEGSVLPGVENFYQSFGGIQSVYFNMYWDKSKAKLQKVDLYDYQ